MLSSLRAEFRKLLTVRSTYFICLISLVIVALAAGYGNGIKAAAPNLHDPSFLATQSTNAVLFIGIILAIVALLLVGHEYRYNGILYTLTSSNNRLKSLLSKFIVISVFVLIGSTIVTFFSPLCSIIGLHLSHKHLAPQTYHTWTVLWQCLFVGWGYSMYALIISAILRSQVGSIVTFLMVPLVGEHIIASIFKSTANYMPFNSLQMVAANELPKATNAVSTAHNVTVAIIYIAVGLIASCILFVRRDAN